jgi:hypothetical protein
MLRKLLALLTFVLTLPLFNFSQNITIPIKSAQALQIPRLPQHGVSFQLRTHWLRQPESVVYLTKKLYICINVR